MTRAFLPPPITDDRALGGSVIERSLRFNDDDSPLLSKTFSSAGNRRTWTYSCWVKRSNITTYQGLLAVGTVDGAEDFFGFENSNRLYFRFSTGSDLKTNALPRDNFSWYHIVVVADTTQSQSSATASDSRLRFYVNGQQITSFLSGDADMPSQNFEFRINNNVLHYIGEYPRINSHLDGYLAEVNFIDGQALDSSYFGYTDFQTGIWRPKKYEGVYGSNGFYLDFNDNSATTAATLGRDRSGNGNDFTPSNFSVASDFTNDSSLDTPSNSFCTWNSLFGNPNSYLVPSEGNLMCNAVSGNNHNRQQSTFVLKSGKWYCEFRLKEGYDSANGTIRLGICTPNAGFRASNNDGIGYQNDNGFVSINYAPHEGKVYQSLTGTDSTVLSSLTTFANGDILGIALDLDNDKFFVSKNGTFFSNGVGLQDPATGANHLYEGSHITSRKANEGFVFVASVYNNKKISADFGQQGFLYTPPTGFKAVCTNNIIPTSPNINPKKHFDIVTYTGNNSTNIIRGLEFKPDFIWFKSRSSTSWHAWFDVVRGRAKGLSSNRTNTEYTSGATQDLVSFDDNGFTLGTLYSWGSVNGNSNSIIAYCWKAGGTAVTNNDGSIASQVSANPEGGFSIVTYTGNGTAGATVGHGLGKAPNWIIIKSRNIGDNWMVYSHSYNGYTDAENRYIELQTTAGVVNDSRMMNNTAPTSSVFSLRADNSTNGNTHSYVAYCWSEIPGFSKFGSYVGNGSSNGQYVYLGFRPAWLLIKRAGTESWVLVDVKRNSNAGRRSPADTYFLPNVDSGDQTGVIYDFLSDGIRFGSNSQNETGAIYHYWAFAEQTGASPFGTEVNAGI